MATIIAKNVTASGVTIPDLSGVYVGPYSEVELTYYFPLYRIEDSIDLEGWIESDVLIINDGTQDLSKEDSLEHTYIDTEYEVPDEFLDLDDTPNTYSGLNYVFLKVNDNRNGVEFTPIMFEDLDDVPTYSGHAGEIVHINEEGTGIEFSDISDLTNINKSIHWTITPTYNGVIRVVGWHYSTNTNSNLSSGGSFQPLEPGYNSYFSFNIKSGFGFPFTLHVSGTSVLDHYPSSDYFSTADDNITVTGTGYYRTKYQYVDKPTVSIVESSKSCTFDTYKFSTWDACGADIIISGIGIEVVPDQNNWDFTAMAYRIEKNGSKTLLANLSFDNTDTHVRAAADKPGVVKYQLTAPIVGSSGEGLVLYTDQNSIGHFCILFSYS